MPLSSRNRAVRVRKIRRGCPALRAIQPQVGRGNGGRDHHVLGRRERLPRCHDPSQPAGGLDLGRGSRGEF